MPFRRVPFGHFQLDKGGIFPLFLPLAITVFGRAGGYFRLAIKHPEHLGSFLELSLNPPEQTAEQRAFLQKGAWSTEQVAFLQKRQVSSTKCAFRGAHCRKPQAIARGFQAAIKLSGTESWTRIAGLESPESLQRWGAKMSRIAAR